MSEGPLAGLRVIELARILAGPWAGQLLADLGAEVIKVESPAGDDTRGWGPPFVTRPDGTQDAAYFHATNRGKASVTADFTTEAGQTRVRDLVARADVVIENFRPGSLARHGLDFVTLRAGNPGLIWCAITGFGQDGPYAAQPAYDDLIQGGCGLAWLMGRAGDGTPRYVASAVADRVVGLAAMGAICAALVHRAKTGEGQRVDVPMFETMVDMVMSDHLSGLTYDPPLDQGGYQRHLSRFRRPYATKDGHVCALIYTDGHWARFFAATGLTDLPQRDPRFRDFASRNAHIDDVYEELNRIFAERTSAEWLALLREADIPAMPLHDLASLMQDPHLAALDFFRRVEHPSEGAMHDMRPAAGFSQTPSQVTRLAPGLGEHGREILLAAGFDDALIEELAASGALILPEQPTDATPTETTGEP